MNGMLHFVNIKCNEAKREARKEKRDSNDLDHAVEVNQHLTHDELDKLATVLLNDFIDILVENKVFRKSNMNPM